MSLNERYTFAAAEGAPVLMHSTDHAGSVNTFRNQVLITDQNGTGTPLKIKLNSSAYANGPHLHLEQNGTGDAGIYYDDGSVYWSTGVDSSEGTEFRWTNSNALNANVRMKLDTSGNLTTGTLTLYKDDDTNNSLVEMLKLERHADDISNDANAEGGYIGLYVTDDNSGLGEGARITWRAENTPDTGEDDVKLSFSTLNDDTLSERMTINAVGNVGIGTTAPDQLLDIESSAVGSSAPTIRITNTNAEQLWTDNEALGGLEFYSADNSGYVGLGVKSSIRAINTNGTYGGYVGLQFNIADSTANDFEAMRIDNGGKVGIGDTDPNQLLTVKGTDAQISIEESDTRFVRIGVEATSDDMCLGWDDSDDMHFGLFTSPTDTTVDTKMIIQSNGKVGIGATSPDGRLEISGNSSTYGTLLKIENTGTTDYSHTMFCDTTNDEPSIKAITIKNNGSETITLTHGGTVNCDTIVKSSGTFRIPHPTPSKTETHYLQHSLVESPTRGDNIYRWQIEVTGSSHTINLPDYYEFLNENDMVWISPVDHFGIGHGKVNEQQTSIEITTNADGKYNILLIGTRKDDKATTNFHGVEILKELVDG